MRTAKADPSRTAALTAAARRAAATTRPAGRAMANVVPTPAEPQEHVFRPKPPVPLTAIFVPALDPDLLADLLAALAAVLGARGHDHFAGVQTALDAVRRAASIEPDLDADTPRVTLSAQAKRMLDAYADDPLTPPACGRLAKLLAPLLHVARHGDCAGSVPVGPGTADDALVVTEWFRRHEVRLTTAPPTPASPAPAAPETATQAAPQANAAPSLEMDADRVLGVLRGHAGTALTLRDLANRLGLDPERVRQVIAAHPGLFQTTAPTTE